MDQPTTNTPAPAPTRQPPVIGPGYTLGSVTDKISAIVLTRPTSRGWYFGFFVSFTLLMLLLYALAKLVIVGVGIWGINIPVGWGFAITNFVWWFGIGHAGTLISAMGWRGSARHWHRYEMAYLILAGLATPLVVSVHTVVSFDFAVANLPGWHSTVFPPYFVAGAIYSGFAMVLVLAIPLRHAYGLQDFITELHLQNMAKIVLATGLMVAYGYFIEAFMAAYSGNRFEKFVQLNRVLGPYWPAYWSLIFCNVLAPQVLWIKRVRQSSVALFC